MHDYLYTSLHKQSCIEIAARATARARRACRAASGSPAGRGRLGPRVAGEARGARAGGAEDARLIVPEYVAVRTRGARPAGNH